MSGWNALSAELDLWSETGSTATFWWRDDDAVEATPELDVLLRCAGSIPVALAVIPARADRGLAERIRDEGSVVVFQHGSSHTDHSAGGNNEYPATRSPRDVSDELVHGRAALSELFGDQALPVFAPPWHGFDESFLPLLPRNGLSGISRKGPRASAFAAPGLRQTNAHVSPIRWSTPPGFADDDAYLVQLVDHLRGRRKGHYDPDEPTGLLTHHLVQNAQSYAFIARLVELVGDHPSAAWLSARKFFALPAPR
jgi:hypothetical protein